MARKAEVGARELKTRLGAYLRRVRQGATLIVTDRGEPIAELRPIDTGVSGAEGVLRRLEAAGAVTRRERRPLGPFREVAGRGASLSEAVVEEREDRF
jgi:prevent-host-death family protein